VRRRGEGGGAVIWDSERFRFLAVGAYNTLFGYVAFVLLYTWLHERMHYLVIAVIAHVIAVINAFFAHRILVFRARGNLLPDFVRFNVTTLGSTAIGLAGLALLVDLGGIHPLLAQGMVMAVTVIITYVAHKRFTFRR
jgi:putative flippase GtrA